MKAYLEKQLKQKGNFAENEVKDLLKEIGIPTTNYAVVKDTSDLDDLTLSYPVALKVCSRDILHKTDVGGVKLNIENQQELVEELKRFQQKFPDTSYLVDEMVEKGAEIIVGLVQDPTFGLSIMVGIGGIFTELYKDVSFRVVEIDRYDAEQMTEELKGKKLLEGFRNMPANKKQVVDLLLKVSAFGQNYMDYLDQLDLNPVFVYENDLCVVDAKLITK